MGCLQMFLESRHQRVPKLCRKKRRCGVQECFWRSKGLLTDAKENGILEPDNVVQASDQILPRMTIKPGLVFFWGGGRKHHMRPAQVYLQRWQSATTSLMKLLSKRQTHRDTITHACLESFPFTCLTFQATSFAGCVCGGEG